MRDKGFDAAAVKNEFESAVKNLLKSKPKPHKGGNGDSVQSESPKGSSKSRSKN